MELLTHDLALLQDCVHITLAGIQNNIATCTYAEMVAKRAGIVDTLNALATTLDAELTALRSPQDPPSADL